MVEQTDPVRCIAIVGANLAGVRAAEALRRNGFDGRVTLIGEESWHPYERPPLSKDMLLDDGTMPSSFFLQNDSWYEENRVDLRLGVRADALDLAAGGVVLATGEMVRADRILLATGAQPRLLRLPGSKAKNIHYLRTKEDSDRIAQALRPGARIVVIGMGVIGAEVAAAARKAGCEVTVIEPMAVPMHRALGNRFGGWLGRVHQGRGVQTRFSTSVTGLIIGDGGSVRAVECNDGARIDCDAVIIGIGVVPATALAEEAGIEVRDGILVDGRCRTSNPGVFAAGDVANHPGFFGTRVRLETFHNASEQGTAAAEAMLGLGGDYCRPCQFWSDQYDLNMQMVGRLDGDLDVTIRGEPDKSEFTAFFSVDRTIVGMLSVNRPADVGAGRRIIEQRIVVDLDRLKDGSMPLRALIKA